MGQRLAVFTLGLLAIAAPNAVHAQSVRSPAARAALAAFASQEPESIDTFLNGIRPVPLGVRSRAQVVASLPPTGALRPSRAELEKIAVADRILDYSARKDVITVKVVHLECAFAGLYYRTVLLVSRRQLSILSAEEFAALAAHEVGHDYDWDTYFSAMQANNNARRQELELRADGLAVLMLRRLGLNPERLVSAVQKTMRYNEHRGEATNTDAYVPLPERVAFIRAVAGLSWAKP